MISRRRIQLPLLLLMAAALSCVSAEALRRDSHRRTETIDERLDENAPDHDDFARNKQTRIVNGEDVVDPTRYPWFVQLRTAPDANGVQRACGGSLIAPDIVLTAAHCADFDHIYVGGVITSLPVTGTRFEATQNVRHPNYPQKLEVDFDVMITALETPVPASVAEPIALNWVEDAPFETGYPLVIMGFGNTGPSVDEVLNQPTTLQRAPTFYVSFEECAVAEDPVTGDRYGNGTGERQTIVRDWWFCTLDGDLEATTATCFGDSGGPVFEETTNEPSGDKLYAVISGGPDGYCGNPYLPLWNNRISYHKQWIVETSCQLSNAPPAEFNCPQGGVAPDGPVSPVEQPAEQPVSTPRPTRNPTPSPVATPTTPSPTNSPTPSPVESPTLAPTKEPTATPTNAPSETPSISTAPNNFINIPPPSENTGLTPRPATETNADDLSLCDICGPGQEATALTAVVNVPTLGSYTCQELLELQMTDTQCGIAQSLTRVACDCQPLPPSPTPPPTDTPTRQPSSTDSPMMTPTLAPVTTPPIFAPTPPPGTPTATPSNAPEPTTVTSPTDAPEPTAATSPTDAPTTALPPNCTSREDFDGTLVNVTVKIEFDDNSNDISWYMVDETEQCYRLGVLQYPVGLEQSQETAQLKLGETYKFIISSASGSGLGSDGSFQVYSDVMLVSGGGDFGHQTSAMFTVKTF